VGFDARIADSPRRRAALKVQEFTFTSLSYAV